MAEDTLTLVLEGDISMADFITAVERFNDLVVSLSRAIAGPKVHIEWKLDELDVGSAYVGVQGVGPDVQVVERVIYGYMGVGDALQLNSPIPYGSAIERKAKRLANLVDRGSIVSMRFQALSRETVVAARNVAEDKKQPLQSYGIIEGTVETITKRRGFKFVLYDSIFDKAVSCFYDPAQQDQVRDIWGKKVKVSGLIHRDPETGKPLNIGDITAITVIEDSEPGSFRKAIGLLPYKPDDEPSEETIRRIRDAW